MTTFKATKLHMVHGAHAATVVLHRCDERVTISEIYRQNLGPLFCDEIFPSEAAAFEAAQRIWLASLPRAGTAYRFRG